MSYETSSGVGKPGQALLLPFGIHVYISFVPTLLLAVQVTVDGGPDEVVQRLTHTAALRGIPVVFALSRKLLGKARTISPLDVTHTRSLLYVASGGMLLTHSQWSVVLTADPAVLHPDPDLYPYKASTSSP